MRLDTWQALCPLMHSPPLVGHVQHSAIPPLSHPPQPLPCVSHPSPHTLHCRGHATTRLNTRWQGRGADSVTYTMSSPYLLTQPGVTHSPAAPNGLALAVPSASVAPATLHIQLSHLPRGTRVDVRQHSSSPMQSRSGEKPSPHCCLASPRDGELRVSTSVRHLLPAPVPSCCLASPALPFGCGKQPLKGDLPDLMWKGFHWC